MNELTEISKQVDRLEAALKTLPPVECPLVHTFTPGLYARQITFPKGILVISKIHRTEHPFVISKGKISIWNNGGVLTLSAPYIGVTKPGTRRVAYVHEETIWTTFHATDKKTPEEVEEVIIEPHELDTSGDLADGAIVKQLCGGIV